MENRIVFSFGWAFVNDLRVGVNVADPNSYGLARQEISKASTSCPYEKERGLRSTCGGSLSASLLKINRLRNTRNFGEAQASDSDPDCGFCYRSGKLERAAPGRLLAASTKTQECLTHLHKISGHCWPIRTRTADSNR